MAAVLPLTGVIRPYAWGSRTSLAELQGRPAPTGEPEAELWLGAHPGDPSTVAGDEGPVSLADLIAGDPDGQLGAGTAAEFGARLPYLMKVLAAESPLSLQAHPDADYAREAFAAQEADPNAPRNYTDAYHKPEMLVALTPFEALCGFRDPQESADALDAFGIPRLKPVTDSLRRGAPGLRDAVHTLLTWPADDREALIAEAVASGASALASALATPYPRDPGVLVALLLHHVRLQPGEAIWMPAGNLHAYLTGTGVEIMAASDNVLRGGLTPKRVDVDELLNVLRFEVLTDPILPPTALAPGVTTWQVPVREFALYRLDLGPATPPLSLPAEGPRIVLGTQGDVYVAEAVDGTPVELTPGTAAYLPAKTGPATAAGVGQLFLAAPAP
ncbi:mannose-6-phosphate isomerase, class I [Pseudosporangium ferrugineum]|uniref:mannose-6-phosphate isomerase n=1 Tax=Pseudosporangium ferrugineum TaxID=439699 RepID=A0A2T0S3G4_9ACTN|nr:mannose-6-phosphate isomerase, class I [Pseudosporangium ferrugineum]PRY27961.1 mannose-6-phosphate isomerase type 1 [Pseudosporangium ferrugineum]